VEDELLLGHGISIPEPTEAGPRQKLLVWAISL
jgi:hypothetical protein